MRLLFVRHGDPDYKNDCLNEIGRREARALAALGPRIGWGTSFVSPLGRAQETAAIVLGRAVPGAHGVEAAVGCTDLSTRGGAAAADSFDLIKTLDWLREFPAVVDPEAASLLADAYAFRKNPDGSLKNRVVWDMYPSYYTERPAYSDYEAWRTTPVAEHSDVVAAYDRIIHSFDAFLAERGYVRDGRHYRVEKESKRSLSSATSASLVSCSPICGTSPRSCRSSLYACPPLLSRKSTRKSGRRDSRISGRPASGIRLT